ncbi:hypothetical protein BASA81_000076 [Batrachochytrium salamandrivorans]|nr:hypothetical protein BASA81_000076 [Batrachochytrium salamandrivorans]
MWSSVKRVHEASEMNASHRPSMEDEHRTIDSFLPDDPQSALFAVYDGHGGRGVVEFISTKLESNLKVELSAEHRGNRSVEECITSAFLITDIETSKQKLESSGSTAVVCLLEHNMLYCANAGDSRAVLGVRSTGQATRLSFDHKASEPTEAARIAKCGGFVRNGRVMGMLTVSRSFGDHLMKHLITAVPFVSTTPVHTGDVIIIACDGMWDVFEDQEAVDFCARQKKMDGEVNLAQALIDECLKRRTTDNVSVIVVEV